MIFIFKGKNRKKWYNKQKNEKIFSGKYFFILSFTEKIVNLPPKNNEKWTEKSE